MLKDEKYTYVQRMENGKNMELPELHEKVINIICEHLKERGVTNVDSLGINADGLQTSIEFGKWTPATDSAFELYDKDGECIAASM